MMLSAGMIILCQSHFYLPCAAKILLLKLVLALSTKIRGTSNLICHCNACHSFRYCRDVDKHAICIRLHDINATKLLFPSLARRFPCNTFPYFQQRIVGIGYNGFPRGCSDDELPWDRVAESDYDTKYLVNLNHKSTSLISSFDS